MRHGLRSFLRTLLVSMIASACSSPTQSLQTFDPPTSVTGVWTFGVSAAPACILTLPYGYGIAPRGGGQAILTQSGNRFSGELLIHGTHSGSIEGTLQDKNVQASFTLDGLNQGVLKPEDAPCRVVASGTGQATFPGRPPGTKPATCYITLYVAGDFACPYSCTASNHIVQLSRLCG